MNDLTPADKKRVIEGLLKEQPIIIKNDFTDAEQIFFDQENQKIMFENWSPRENLTYSTREITLDQAWDYATQYVPERVAKATLF